MTPAPQLELTPPAGAREALWATGGLLLLLGVGKSFAASIPYGSDVVFTAAAAFQLYVPLWLIQRAGEAPESHHIHAHGLILGSVAALRRGWLQLRRRSGRLGEGAAGPFSRVLAYYGRGARLDAPGLLRDLGLAVALALLVFPAFGVGHWVFQSFLAGKSLAYHPRLPADVVEVLVKNTFLVGLPEELFYRGFLETRLERVWPTKVRILLIPLGRTVILASGLFALGHFLGEWNPARLGPFFPAFLFSALTRRSHSIAGAVLFHGLSNAFSATLMAGYGPP